MSEEVVKAEFEAITGRVTELVLRRARLASVAPLPGPNAQLAGLGVDSLGLADLALDLEEAFEIAIPDEAINWTAFRSIGTVADLVSSLHVAKSEVSCN